MLARPSILDANILIRYVLGDKVPGLLESLPASKLVALDVLKKSLLHQAFSGAL